MSSAAVGMRVLSLSCVPDPRLRGATSRSGQAKRRPNTGRLGYLRWVIAPLDPTYEACKASRNAVVRRSGLPEAEISTTMTSAVKRSTPLRATR